MVAPGLIYLFIFILIFGCVGSSFLCEGSLQLRRAGATLHRGARASSLSRPLLLRSTGSRRAGSVVVAHGPSCPAACGIFPDQGSNPCPLHWQADSQPLRHQGSPLPFLLRQNLLQKEIGDLWLGTISLSLSSPLSNGLKLHFFSGLV